MSKITETVSAAAEPIAAANGCRLWDAEYIREGGRMTLRVYIDRADGVSTDHCEAVSRALEAELDKNDPIAEPYVLEVSSPGLERALKKPWHFEESVGKLVAASLYRPLDGQKKYQGELKAYNGENITIGEKILELKDVASVKQVFLFNI
ncbi:ribosome maturation factor RimP [Clostridia bacterium]|nr:ribosome maturation factor RimP [Clostridia bacterium]